jgi:hypothetical protein
VFPELESDVKIVLERWEYSSSYSATNNSLSIRIWKGQMDSEQLEKIFGDVQAMHKSMKNIMEIAFAISPILVLSPTGWSYKSTSGLYLLRVSFILLVSAVINHCQGVCRSRQ